MEDVRKALGTVGVRSMEVRAAGHREVREAAAELDMVAPEYSAGRRARVGAGPLIAPHRAVVLDGSPGGGLPLRERRELAPLLADVARR